METNIFLMKFPFHPISHLSFTLFDFFLSVWQIKIWLFLQPSLRIQFFLPFPVSWTNQISQNSVILHVFSSSQFTFLAQVQITSCTLNDINAIKDNDNDYAHKYFC